MAPYATTIRCGRGRVQYGQRHAVEWPFGSLPAAAGLPRPQVLQEQGAGLLAWSHYDLELPLPPPAAGLLQPPWRHWYLLLPGPCSMLLRPVACRCEGWQLCGHNHAP